MGGGSGGPSLGTVLFTDLVGSTDLRSKLGDDDADKVRRVHDALIADAVDAHAGGVVKGLGDGVMASFGSAADAVAAAVAIQRAVARLNRRGDLPPGVRIELRVGVSAGDVTWEDGDCFGTPVVEAARLCAAARGGQVLVADVVRVLAGSRGGHAFESVGTLELKGLPEPVAAAEVVWEDDSSDAAVPLPSPLAVERRLAFVGRDAERQPIARAWKEVLEGGRRTVLLAGEPGVGKTRLASEVANEAHRDGALVLFGRCDEDLDLPYQPFVEALRTWAALVPVEQLAEQLGPHGGDLARIVPELRELVPGLPAALDADPETERWRLLDAVASWLSTASVAQPVVLVLDDLHWAGRPTLVLLRHVQRSDRPMRLLIIGTYRDTDLSRTHPLAEVLADLRRETGVDRVSLSGLDVDGVAALIEAAAGQDTGAEGRALAEVIHAETEGNPFFTGEVLLHLVEAGAVDVVEGRWTLVRPLEQLGIPEGVREVIGRRLTRLSDAANDVLSRAAVIGQDFELAVLSAVCDQDDDAVAAALEEAAAAGLVREGSGLPLRYQFAHALVRTTLYEELATVRRVRLHGRVGEAIEKAHGNHIERYLPELARHFAEAAAAGDVERGVAYAWRAADAAMAQLAHEEAVSLYERALELLDLDGGGDPVRRVDLMVVLGTAQQRAGDVRYRDLLLEAAGAAQALGDADRLAAAALANNRGGYSAYLQVDFERVSVLEAAVEAVGPTPTAVRARLLGTLATELSFARDQRVAALVDEAVAVARQVGDPSALGAALVARAAAAWSPEALDTRRQDAAETVALAAELGDPALRCRGLHMGVVTALESGDATEAVHHAADLAKVAAELHQPWFVWVSCNQAAAVSLVTGRYEQAGQLIDRGHRAAVSSGQPEADITRLAFLASLERERGGLGDLLGTPAEAAAPWGIFLAGWVAGMAAEAGDLDACEQHWAAVAGHDHLAIARMHMPWHNAACGTLPAAIAMGDTATVESLVTALSPHSGQFVITPPSSPMGAVDTYVARGLVALGRLDDAVERFAAAATLLERMPAPPYLARTNVAWATALLERSAPGDGDEARRLATAARDVAHRLDLPTLGRDADAVLARC